MTNSLLKSIAIYQAKDGSLKLDVYIEDESVWLTQKQIGELFDRDTDTIGVHLKNIYKTGELEEISTTEDFSVVQQEGPRQVKRTIKFYNLDTIISVGYRVNSIKGTQFRIWSTKVLKDHILKGYVFNQQRLMQTGLKDFDEAVALIKQVVDTKLLTKDETKGLVEVISRYTKTWVLLRQYDSGGITKLTHGQNSVYILTIPDALTAITKLKDELLEKQEATDLFGYLRGEYFEGIIGSIYQTFRGKELYYSVEEKAAHLLYFIIKDHPFSDGNKRVGSLLFILFLARNKYLFAKNGEPKLNANGLAALALLIAESDPKQKDLMIKLIIHFVAQD